MTILFYYFHFTHNLEKLSMAKNYIIELTVLFLKQTFEVLGFERHFPGRISDGSLQRCSGNILIHFGTQSSLRACDAIRLKWQIYASRPEFKCFGLISKDAWHSDIAWLSLVGFQRWTSSLLRLRVPTPQSLFSFWLVWLFYLFFLYHHVKQTLTNIWDDLSQTVRIFFTKVLVNDDKGWILKTASL